MKPIKINLVLLFLLVTLHIQGENIYVENAGGLSALIGEKKDTMTELQLSGSLNGTDVKFIREMAALVSINMKEAKIVSGGEAYDGTYYTKNDTIGVGMFSNMKTWTSVILPNGIKCIDSFAFAQCENLESIVLAETVTMIGGSCFEGDKKLQNVIIPSACTTIGSSAFAYCSSLTSINIPDGITVIPYSCFSSCTEMSTITGCKNVSSIGEYAFANSHLTSYPFGNSLKSIDRSAFQYSYLVSVTIPGSVRTIGEYAFYACSYLEEVIFEEGNTFVGSHMFLRCKQLSKVSLASTITRIDYGAFCEVGIETIALPTGLTDLVEACFYECPNLVSIDIPTGVTRIGENMFGKCKKLQSVKIPATVNTIMGGSFKECSSLSEVICLNPTPPSLGVDVFLGLPLATRNLTVPDGSEALYAAADQWKDFYSEKPTLVIDGSKGTVGVIDAGTLEEIIAGNVDNIEELVISGPLNGTDFRFIRSMFTDNKLFGLNIERATIVSGGDSYLVYNDISYNTEDNVVGVFMFMWLEQIRSIVLPSNLTSIEASAFTGCSNLTTVKISETVTRIGAAAFSTCYSLSDVELPPHLTSIDDEVFWSCASLKAVTLPAGIKAIGTRAFYYSGIQEANIPEGVTTIGKLSFGSCGSLASITIPASVTYINPNALEKSLSLTSIIWNTSETVQQFIDLSDSNCLLYLNSDASVSTGITKIKNVIRNGVADNITLVSGKPFHCPIAFKTKKISCEKDFSLTSGIAEAAGWETIVLPFNVESYYNEEKGALAPFSSGGVGTKPFWLRTLTDQGFEDASVLEANKPYIISMPNNNDYDSNYNIVGTVSFSAENEDGITIPATPQTMYKGEFVDYSLVPTYELIKASDMVYALNTSMYSKKPAGSVFVRSLRDVTPFEAYVISKEALKTAPAMYSIGGAGGDITALEKILLKEANTLHIYAQGNTLYIETDKPRLISIYGSDGIRVRLVSAQQGKNAVNNLPTGIYFLEGKKVIIGN